MLILLLPCLAVAFIRYKLHMLPDSLRSKRKTLFGLHFYVGNNASLLLNLVAFSFSDMEM